METGIYIRVSTDEQAQEGFSIRAQEQKLADYARIKDWNVYSVYKDEGISGKNIKDRLALLRLIEDVKSGSLKNILVFKIDRLSRKISDLQALVELFYEHNCVINSISENIDTQTPAGRLQLNMLGSFAEFERENIIERVKLGREKKAKEGYSLSSTHASYGYDRPCGQKIQTVNDEEAEIVREIFDMYVNQNMTILGITKSLNMRNIPTKENALWDRGSAKDVLTNCNLIGKIRYNCNEYDGLHEPIISSELFETAQRLLNKNKKTTSTKKPSENNYFVGILFCNSCDKKLMTHHRKIRLKNQTEKIYVSYRCGYKSEGRCDSGDINHKKIEAAFVDFISYISRFSAADKIVFNEEERIKTDRSKAIANFNKKLNELFSKSSQIENLFIENRIDFESYENMKRKINKDKKFINSEIEKINASLEDEMIITESDIILSLRENWELLDDKEKRQFLLLFINKIIVTKEKGKYKRVNEVVIESIEFNSS
ncbi:MAG: recombinase family protein [Oscillospiraceae bacterium]|nr:recombinase family protein [Oscillospiraceae bacterium]